MYDPSLAEKWQERITKLLRWGEARRSREIYQRNCGRCEEPRLLWHQAPQTLFQQFCAQRLFDKEGSADCVGFLANLRIAGDHDYGNVNVLLPQDSNEIRAAHSAHPMVSDKQVG